MTDEKIRKLSVCLSSKTSVIVPKHLLGYDTSSYLLLFSAHGCNVPVKVAMPLSNVSVPKVVLTIRKIVNTYLEK